MENEELKNYLLKADEKKSEYCRNYTGHGWDDITQYDLSVNCETFGIRGCVDYIKRFLELRQSL